MKLTFLLAVAFSSGFTFAATREQAKRSSLEAELATAVERGEDFFALDALYELNLRDGVNLPKRLNALYGSDISEMLIGKVNLGLGKRYLALLIDPGVADRVDAFIDFCNGLPNLARMSLAKIREAFANSLGGPVTVYRGMKVTDRQLEFLLAKGMAAPEFERHYDFDGSNSVLSDFFMSAFTNLAPRTLVGDASESKALVAVSEYAEVAEGLGNFYGNAGGGSRRLQVFKIKVPAIRVLRTGGILFHRSGGDMRFWEPTTGLALKAYAVNEPKFEVYVAGFIPKSWIENVEAKELPKVQLDFDSNYAAFNYDRVRWERGWSVIGTGIPYSTDDFFSVLRNDADTVLRPEKLLRFLREEAGPRFKAQLAYQLQLEPYAARRTEESQNRSLEREGAGKLRKKLSTSPKFPLIIHELPMSDDCNAQLAGLT